MKVLVTGASGFVGKAIVERLWTNGHEVSAASRSPPLDLPAGVAYQQMESLESNAKPLPSACVTDVVVHAAARAHVMHGRTGNDLASFRAVNVRGSLAIVRQAHASGARRFVHISSVKVLGEQSLLGRPLSATSAPAPADAYAISKLEAELALADFCSSNGMELVIIRPPLVYGPGVKANFERLMQAIARRRPLPLGRLTTNRRSLVALDNLVDLVAVCVGHPGAANKTLLVSDGEDLSTVALVRRLAKALGVSPTLWPVPVWVLRAVGEVTGRRDAVLRLSESLQVDISATCRSLGWTPPKTVDDGLAQTAAFFLGAA